MIDLVQRARSRPLGDKELAENLYLLQTQGYCAFPDFIDVAECAELKRGLVHALETFQVRAAERSALDRYLIHDLLCQDIDYARLLEDPRLQQIVAPLLGEHWIMYAFTSSSLPPRGNSYGSRIHVDCPRLVPGYAFNIGMIWALDEFSPENGATKVLPGSHHSELVPSPELFAENCAQMTCGRGTLIVFHARLFHRAGDNQTDFWRHSLTMNACRAFAKQRMDWVRFIPESISSGLNSQARRLIGFDTRLPTSLDEFFVPESERLYKANQG